MFEKKCAIGGNVVIGYTPENDAREFRFDARKWMQAWPDARIEMLVARPSEETAYPAAIRVEGSVVVWTVKRYDTEIPGTGRMWLVFLGKDGEQLGLTPATMIRVTAGPPNIDGEEPPETEKPWVKDVFDAADRAEQAAERAEEIAEALAGGGSGDLDSGLFLPSVDEDDNGKVLTVVGGKWAAAELPKYDGAYEVTPLAGESTTLETAQKFMDSNVVVNKVPYYETSNQAGGETVYIATEVEIYGEE